MIDKVRVDKVSVDSGYNYLDHGRQGKNPAVQAYENTPGTKEAEQKKAEKKQKPIHSAKSDPGVILDISSKSAKDKGQTENKEKAAYSWQGVVQKLVIPVKRVFQMLKDFWHSDSEDMQLSSLDGDSPHLAHNSDLLTYYDRKGMLVEMDESDKHRVLFGDKHVLKL